MNDFKNIFLRNTLLSIYIFYIFIFLANFMFMFETGSARLPRSYINI